MNIFTFKDIKIIQFPVAHFKKLISIILVCSSFYLSSQNQVNSSYHGTDTKTVQNSNSKIIGASNTQIINLNGIRHDTCLNKKFSIVTYVFEDSSVAVASHSMAAINSQITQKINYLNNLFKRICVSFENCKTVVIPNYTYDNWDNATVENVVYSNYSTANTINLYLPTTIKFSRCQVDYGFMPDSPSVNNQKLLVVSQLFVAPGPDLAHAFGHFFGLYHTHEEINSTPASPPPSVSSQYTFPIYSNEFVDGSNCKTYGDGICDTEADPYPANTVYNRNHIMCDYNGGVKDGKGQYYTPPFDNFMSFYSCRCRYSQEQYNKMAETVKNKRLYLH